MGHTSHLRINVRIWSYWPMNLRISITNLKKNPGLNRYVNIFSFLLKFIVKKLPKYKKKSHSVEKYIFLMSVYFTPHYVPFLIHKLDLELEFSHNIHVYFFVFKFVLYNFESLILIQYCFINWRIHNLQQIFMFICLYITHSDCDNFLMKIGLSKKLVYLRAIPV